MKYISAESNLSDIQNLLRLRQELFWTQVKFAQNFFFQNLKHKFQDLLRLFIF